MIDRYDTVVLDGELDLLVIADGEFGAFTKIAGGDTYTGDYVVTPKAHSETILETQDKTMLDNVRVLKVPYWETSNLFDGKTAYIAEE